MSVSFAEDVERSRERMAILLFLMIQLLELPLPWKQ